jgi:hypothetical protein
MRKDCAEKIVLGGKKKKVRRNSTSYKKPISKNVTMGELLEMAIAKGGSQTVFELNGYRISITPSSETRS